MKISEDQIDALKETINISAGQSATALSDMLGCRVNISVPTIKIIGVGDLESFLSKEINAYASFFSSFEGLFDGKIIVAYESIQKSKLVELIYRRFDVKEDEESILSETSNIIFGAFMAGISNFLNIRINFSPPEPVKNLEDLINAENAEAIIGEVLLKPEVNGEIESKIILIPTNRGLAVLVEKLKEMI